MTSRDRAARLQRYAMLAAAHAVLVVLALAGVLGGAGRFVVLLVAVPLAFLSGAFQAELALNDALAEHERSRWRIALWFVPWTMTLYWWRYVRGPVD